MRRSKNDAGYGNFSLNGRQMTAHRAAYTMYNGPVEADQVVRHTCDNPPCVNPAHLLVGTQKDNVNDARERGRLRGGATDQVGAKNNNARVTEQQARQVLALHSQGVPQHQIAKEIGMERKNVWAIVHRKSWAYLPESGFDSALPGLIAEFSK